VESFSRETRHSSACSAMSPKAPTRYSTLSRIGLRLRRLWLNISVHAHAIAADPLAYAQAVLWRIRGFKVRSRNRIAPLCGRSPSAYALWSAREEAAIPIASVEAGGSDLQILPIVDCRYLGDLAATLASIASAKGAMEPVLIGGPDDLEQRRVALPRDLRSLVPAQGAWICPLLAGDAVSPNSFVTYIAAIQREPSTSIFYSDDDLISSDRKRTDPHFKPRWNPELFQHHDYVSGAAVIHVSPEAISKLPERGWVEALVDNCLSEGASPSHIPKMLHHRRTRPVPAIPPKPSQPLSNRPLVSVIIPTRNHAALLATCVAGVEQADYDNVEIMVVDNESDDVDTLNYLDLLQSKGHRLFRRPGQFNFSAINNDAVREASGSILCFLNNDVEMVDHDWLTLLVRQAVRPEIGAVGPMLLYPDRTIQHAGVYLGIGGGAGHAHRFQGENDSGYFERARLPQLVSAVTGACLVVDHTKFLDVRGFDAELFPVAFNDVDLCLKLNERGWHSFYEPRAKLIHHESKSRGSDRSKLNRVRFAGELAALKVKWGTDINCDPFHHPELSPYSEQFVVGL
jgi:GT2 family glycosyltransferase